MLRRTKIFLLRLSQDYSQAQIIEELCTEYDLSITDRTLRRRLQDWNVYQKTVTPKSEQLNARVRILFFENCLSDKEILIVLRDEGIAISSQRLSRLRLQLGLYRRTNIREQRLEAREIAQRVVAEELEKGVIQSYGKQKLYDHFRRRGLMVSR